MTRQTFYLPLLLILLLIAGCSSNDDNEDPIIDDPSPTLYFPPLTSSTWETVSPEELGWDTGVTPTLNTLLQEKGTKAFIILRKWEDSHGNLFWILYPRQYLVLGIRRKNFNSFYSGNSSGK